MYVRGLSYILWLIKKSWSFITLSIYPPTMTYGTLTVAHISNNWLCPIYCISKADKYKQKYMTQSKMFQYLILINTCICKKINESIHFVSSRPYKYFTYIDIKIVNRVIYLLEALLHLLNSEDIITIFVIFSPVSFRLFRCNGASHDIKIPIKQLALRTTPLYYTTGKKM